MPFSTWMIIVISYSYSYGLSPSFPAFHLSMKCYACTIAAGSPHLLEHEAAKWSYICLQQDILVTSQGIFFLWTRFLFSGGGPWQEQCLEAKRILAYAEFLFRENDLSGTKWGA